MAFTPVTLTDTHSITIPIGTSHFPAGGTGTWNATAAINAGATQYQYGIDLSNWTASDLVDMLFQFSGDNGVSWLPPDSAQGDVLVGGPATDKQGNATLAGGAGHFPPKGPSGLLARIRVIAPSSHVVPQSQITLS